MFRPIKHVAILKIMEKKNISEIEILIKIIII